MLHPLNTEWNRKAGMLPDKGKANLLGLKHGIIYFTWTDMDGSVTFLQCDEGVFKKHFNFKGADAEQLAKATEGQLTALHEKKTKFLKYPFEVTGKS